MDEKNRNRRRREGWNSRKRNSSFVWFVHALIRYHHANFDAILGCHSEPLYSPISVPFPNLCSRRQHRQSGTAPRSGVVVDRVGSHVNPVNLRWMVLLPNWMQMLICSFFYRKDAYLLWSRSCGKVLASCNFRYKLPNLFSTSWKKTRSKILPYLRHKDKIILVLNVAGCS